MAILGLLFGNKPWFTHPIHTQKRYRGRTDGCRVQSFEELCGHSILLDGVAMAGYGFTVYSYHIPMDSIALKKAIYIYKYMDMDIYIYSDYSGNDRNMARTFCCPWIFTLYIPIISHVGPPSQAFCAPGCVALPARSSDVGPSEIHGDPTTNSHWKWPWK